ncbi:transposase [Bradyrhizobium sp. 142]|nr:transposase [Bradyrhizobium sp. 142]
MTRVSGGRARTLKDEGLPINRKRVQRLMRRMGIAALGPKPNTTRPVPGHKSYPYLLRNMMIDRPNRCGRPTSRIYPSAAAFSISSPSPLRVAA